MGVHERKIRLDRRGKDGAPVHTFEAVHPSVFERRRSTTPPYEPANLRDYLARHGEPAPSPTLPTARTSDAGVPA
jgi:hypothetical protein